MTEPLDNPHDRLLDRDLREVLGGDAPDPALRDRVLRAAQGKRHSGRLLPMPRKRSSWGAMIAAAAAIALALGVFAYAATQLNQQAPGTAPATTPSQPAPSATAAEGNRPQKAPQKAPQDQPKNQQDDTPPAPQRDPDQPAPAQPEPAAPQPGPSPEPSAPEPAPEPPRSDVESPEPGPETEPRTAPAPDSPRERRVVATVSADAKLKFRADGTSKWQSLEGTEIEAGWQVQAARATDFTLSSGAQLRLDGELEWGAHLKLTSRGTKLYIDNLGSEAVTISADMGDCLVTGAVYIELASTALELSILHGSVTCGSEKLAAGEFAKLAAKGLSGRRALKDAERAPALLRGMPPRVLLDREFHDGEKLFAGTLRDGLAFCEGENSLVEFSGNELLVLPGAQLRLRFRVTGGKALYVQIIDSYGNKQFGLWKPVAAQGEWTEWEIALSELQGDGNRGVAPPAEGDVIRSVKIYVQDGADARLELDRVTIVRVQ